MKTTSLKVKTSLIEKVKSSKAKILMEYTNKLANGLLRLCLVMRTVFMATGFHLNKAIVNLIGRMCQSLRL